MSDAVQPASSGNNPATAVQPASSGLNPVAGSAIPAILAATHPGFVRDSPSGDLVSVGGNIFASLADLLARDNPNLPNGTQAYVIDQGLYYSLDTTNAFTDFSPLILARTVNGGTGRWFRRSKAYVVANFTFWVVLSQSGVTHKKVFGLTPGQMLSSNAAVNPDIILDLSNTLIINGGGALQGFLSEACTDAQGNLWVSHYNTANLVGHTYKIALNDTLQSGSPVPVVDLSGIVAATDKSDSVVCFDKQNNLWNGGTSSFRKIGQYQYGLSGAPTPLVVLQGAVAWSSINRYMIFDQDSNLWFTNSFGGVAQISKITPAQYAASNAALVPSVLWSGANIGAVQDLAFDSNGLLWTVEYVTGLGNGHIKAFDPTQASGNPAPVIDITCATLSGGVGLAFDSGGNLWIGNNDNGTIFKIQKSDLAASGVKVPTVILGQTVGQNIGSSRFAGDPQRIGLAASGVPFT